MNVLRVSAFVFLFGSSAVFGAPQLTKEAVDTFNQAVRYINQREYEAALPYLDQVIVMVPDFFDARYARAACLYGARQFEQALADVQEAERLKPGDSRIRSIRAGIYYETDRLEPALQDFNALLAKKPGDAEALLGRGVVLVKLDRVEEGARDLKAFLRKRPNDPNAPQIRKVVKAIEKGVTDEELYSEDEAPAETPTPTPMPKKASTRKANRAPQRSVSTNQLLDDLFKGRGAASDAYQRKVNRGEKATVTQDMLNR